ncbi:hypothetical protein OK016_08490 [Vibrio chagasii]|nr:hypothetical protein [Vibrio chagasii]
MKIGYLIVKMKCWLSFHSESGFSYKRFEADNCAERRHCLRFSQSAKFQERDHVNDRKPCLEQKSQQLLRYGQTLPLLERPPGSLKMAAGISPKCHALTLLQTRTLNAGCESCCLRW